MVVVVVALASMSAGSAFIHPGRGATGKSDGCENVGNLILIEIESEIFYHRIEE